MGIAEVDEHCDLGDGAVPLLRRVHLRGIISTVDIIELAVDCRQCLTAGLELLKLKMTIDVHGGWR